MSWQKEDLSLNMVPRLYSLKKEFDSIPKAELNYIKTSGNGIIVRHNGFQITNEKS